MKRTLTLLSAFALLLSTMVLPAAADSHPAGFLPWEGQGTDSDRCDKADDENRRLEDGWIHWIVTQTRGVTASELVVVTDSSTIPVSPTKTGPRTEFFTDFVELASITSATFNYSGTVGDNPQFVISDYCAGDDGGLQVRSILSGEKFIDGVDVPNDLLAGWVIEIFEVEVGDVFEPLLTSPTEITTDAAGVWTAEIGPFSPGTTLDVAVCEQTRLGWEQLSPTTAGDDTIVNPDDDRVCHVRTIDVDAASPTGLDFENANEELTVSKTVETSYVRDHDWSISKSVETENGETLDGDPKVWLYIDGDGDETASWTIETTYDGFTDSAFVVSGTITIENTGLLPATVTGITDRLSDGTLIEDVDIACFFGDSEAILAPEAEVSCDYQVALYDRTSDGVENFVGVETQRSFYTAAADVVWGDPTVENNSEVSVFDTVTDTREDSPRAPVGLASYSASTQEEGDVLTVTYPQLLKYEDYGDDNCGAQRITNVAELVGDGEARLASATAILRVNVQCYLWESAWAEADSEDDGVEEVLPFCDAGFNNWGWTNQIEPGSYEMTLWAGAGQCDTSRATNAGTVRVEYDVDGYVTATFNVDDHYLSDDAAFYAGESEFPTLRNNRRTTAPGQYTNMGPFDGSAIWTIAHINVGIPDPDFGPDTTP